MNDIWLNPVDKLIYMRLNETDKRNWKKQSISAFSLQQTYINSRECPHCGSHNVVSKGNYKARKRYQCRDCDKSYNDLTKTPFSGIHHLDKLKKYLNCLIRGDSIRKAADIVEISVTTSFSWRHKLLNGLSLLPSPKMKNVKEILELEMPYSHKGQRSRLSNTLRRSKVSAVFVCDRTGKLDSDSITYSNRAKNPIFGRISEISNEHTDIICSPKLNNIINSLNINIKATHSSYSTLDLINQTVSSWQAWMKRFHGVATKYLSNYLHWFDYLDNTLFNQDGISNFVQLQLNHRA